MSGLESVLDTRASFELAALVVTWAAVVALALVAAHLHVRLRRLEEGAAGSTARNPLEAFGRLVGRRSEELAGDGERLVLFVSSDCRSCDSLLTSLQEVPPATSWAVAWIDGAADASAVPAGVRLLDSGPAVADELGIRVTPFALVVGADGTVLRAGPVGSAAALHRMTGRARRGGAALTTAPSH